MAKVLEGARSDFSGKADGLVYVKLNGEVYTRKLPKWKKESFSKGMLQNQQRFKRANEFCALFKDSVIPRIWNGISPKMTGYALFLKTNMAAFGADGSLEDFQKIRLSTGNLTFPPGFEANRSAMDESLVEVNWPKEMHVGGVHLFDQLMVISSRDGEFSDITPTGIIREDLGGIFSLPDAPMPQSPGPMHLFLFFASRDYRDYSESVCFEV